MTIIPEWLMELQSCRVGYFDRPLSWPDFQIPWPGLVSGASRRRVFEELGKIRVVDVVLPTQSGPTIRRRCVTRPTDHQAIQLQRLGLNLPSNLPETDAHETIM